MDNGFGDLHSNFDQLQKSVDNYAKRADTYFQEGEDAYNEAIAALEEDPPNIVNAKKSALIAMALFEKAAEEYPDSEAAALAQKRINEMKKTRKRH